MIDPIHDRNDTTTQGGSAMSSWLAVMAFLVSVMALGLAVLNITETSPDPTRIVVLDMTAITRDKVLELAASGLEDEELEHETLAWAENLATRLNALASVHNVVILPQGIGVYGAQDITAAFLRHQQPETEAQ